MKKRIMELEKLTAGSDGSRTSSRMEIADLMAEMRGKETELKEKTRQLLEKEKRIKVFLLLCRDKFLSAFLSLKELESRGHGMGCSSDDQIAALEDKLRNKEMDLRDLERLRASERSLKERASQLANKVHELEDMLRNRNVEVKKEAVTVSKSDPDMILVLQSRVGKMEGELSDMAAKCALLEKSLAASNSQFDILTAEKRSVSATAENAKKELAKCQALLKSVCAVCDFSSQVFPSSKQTFFVCVSVSEPSRVRRGQTSF